MDAVSDTRERHRRDQRIDPGGVRLPLTPPLVRTPFCGQLLSSSECLGLRDRVGDDRLTRPDERFVLKAIIGHFAAVPAVERRSCVLARGAWRIRGVHPRPEEDVMEPVPLLDCAGRRRSPATLFNFHQDTCPATRVHADVGMSPSCAAEDLGGSRAWSPANGGGRRHRAAWIP